MSKIKIVYIPSENHIEVYDDKLFKELIKIVPEAIDEDTQDWGAYED